ncbi:MAG: plasmid pRiA4b ORF-3 family protein [Oscillospiraceae bacterium]|nr:plasmid pRiA4b ORF-3 family protein [Oscillospiraceae bacterium]
MYLECTKKLLDYLGVKPDKTLSRDSHDQLYTWTANLLTINRRKVIVVVHAASRCQFVLYGITAKSISKLPELIFKGIRVLLQSEYVSPEIIEKYLEECGSSVVYTANSSRKIVAICNKACERLDMFGNLFETNDMFQKKLLPWMNLEFITNNKNNNNSYSYAHEILIELLKNTYGENIRTCHAAELTVTLHLNSPCKRTLILPVDLNLYQLHRVLQGAFEWQDHHLYQFVLETDREGRPSKIAAPPVPDEWNADGIVRLDSTEVTIKDVLSVHSEFYYEYDFGDGWTHTIKLNRFIENCDVPYPHCIAAMGDSPMEDCGGPCGFEDTMAILKQPNHPDYEDVCRWVRGTLWQPLDVDIINRRIDDTHRIPFPVVWR